MKNSRRSRVILLALAAAWSQYSPAAVNVDRTRIIMDAPQKTVAITLNNDDKTTPFLAQSWVTDADGVRTDALMALPPLQRIDAGQKSQVRITQVRGLTDKLLRTGKHCSGLTCGAFPEAGRRQRPAAGHAEPAETVLPSESHYQKQQ